MPTNLSRCLFFAFCLAVVAAFGATIVQAMAWTNAGSWDGAWWVPAVPTFVFAFVLVFSRGDGSESASYFRQIWRRYPGFLPAIRQIAPVFLWALTVPFGTLVGGLLFEQHALSAVAGWVVFGWFVFPLGPSLGYWLFSSAEPQVQRTRGVDAQYLRGTAIAHMTDAYGRCLQLPKDPGEPRIVWGGLPLPERHSEGHFSVFGATRSGKTVTMRLLMQSVLRHIRPGSGWRAVIYDPKNEFRSILSGMPLSCPVVTLNPFDVRSVAWDIAADIDEPAIGDALAHLLVEQEGNTQESAFWVKAAQNLTGAVMTAFILQAPGRWSLRDLVLTMSLISRAKRLLEHTPETKLDYHNNFEAHERRPDGDRTIEGIKHTIAANMARLKPIAAIWSRASAHVSLREWTRDEYIIHLGRDEDYVALDAINRVLFRRISQLLVKGDQLTNRRSWVFIDEAQFAGNLEGLPNLLTTGSSFGVRVCIASQTVEGFRDVYRDKKADSILGQCANKAFLRTDSPDTAEYAARVIGNVERLERLRSASTTRGRDSEAYTEGTSEQIQTRPAVMPEEIRNLPPATQKRFYGYYWTPPIGPYDGWVYQGSCLCPKGKDKNFIPRPPAEYMLSDWTLADEERLGPHLLRILAPELYDGGSAEVPAPGPAAPRRTHLDDAYIPPPASVG